MKKLLITLLLLIVFPSLSFGSDAAPYTKEALQKINKVIEESPKIKYDGKITKEEYHKQFVEHFSDIFNVAGYSFNDTIDKIVDDLQNNPEAIPTDPDSVYNKVYMLMHIMMYECGFDKVDCLKFFPPETGQSIQWLVDNSKFSKEDIDSHFKGK